MANCFGWQPSLLSMDLSRGTEWGAMNIHMNQTFADMSARPYLYMTPTMDCAYSPYGTAPGNMNFLLDPSYTMNQWQFNMNNGGNGWNGFNTNPWGGNWGWNGGTTGGTTSTASTPSERSYQKKYNKLLSLVKQLASDESRLPAGRKDALDEIAKHPQGKTYEEKFNNLKAEYDKVNKTDIKNFLASKASRGYGIDGKDTSDEARSFYGKLQGIGYEFDNSRVDAEITNLYTTISGIKDGAGAYDTSNDILGNLASGVSNKYDILDVVSSWNTQKKGSSGNEKRIISLIKEKYDALPSGADGDAARAEVKNSVITPLVNALISRARGLNENLDAASQTKMNNAITRLETALNATGATVDANLSHAFDEVYVLARNAAVTSLALELKDTFGAVDPDLFNNTLYVEETKKDLIEEGFTETDITAATVAVTPSLDSGVYTAHVDETLPARDQLASITGTGDDKALTKATSITGFSGVSEAWIDKNTGKVYILKENEDGKEEIYQLDESCVTVEDGKVTRNPAGTYGEIPVTARDIALSSADARVAAAREAAEAEALQNKKNEVTNLLARTEVITATGSEATIGGTPCPVYKETKGDERQFVLVDGLLYEYVSGAKGSEVSASSIIAVYDAAVRHQEELDNDKEFEGKEVARLLCEWTTDEDQKYISNRLDEINKDNILSFMKGVYNYPTFNHKGKEMFLEKLDDDTSSDNGVTLDKKKNLINCYIKAALQTGLITERDPLIKELKQLMENGTRDGKNDFNKTYNGALLIIFGAHTNYNEKIDDVMYDIWEKIKSAA